MAIHSESDSVRDELSSGIRFGEHGSGSFAGDHGDHDSDEALDDEDHC